MKKTISAVLVCALLIAALPGLFSCEGKGPTDDSYTAKEIADAIMAAYDPEEFPDTGFEHIYIGADEDSENYVDAKYAGLIIDRAYAPLEEYEYIYDLAFYTPVGRRMFEVDVLKVKPGDEKSIAVLKGVLERRLRNKSGEVITYEAQDTPLFENAKIITLGSYVILLATTDNDKAEKVINDMIKIKEE